MKDSSKQESQQLNVNITHMNQTKRDNWHKDTARQQSSTTNLSFCGQELDNSHNKQEHMVACKWNPLNHLQKRVYVCNMSEEIWKLTQQGKTLETLSYTNIRAINSSYCTYTKYKINKNSWNAHIKISMKRTTHCLYKCYINKNAERLTTTVTLVSEKCARERFIFLQENIWHVFIRKLAT